MFISQGRCRIWQLIGYDIYIKHIQPSTQHFPISLVILYIVVHDTATPLEEASEWKKLVQMLHYFLNPCYISSVPQQAQA